MMEAFSPRSYTNLIRDILAQGYRFVMPDEFDLVSPERQVILRHDVDYSPRKAVELAKLDRVLGVRSLFFFLVRGYWYNLLGHHTQTAINEIHTMGFPIGLHYAPPPDIGDDCEAHRRQLVKDLALMKAEFPPACSSFSWHIPPPLALGKGGFSAPEGMVDMYSEHLFQQAKYISDSSLKNPYADLRHAFVSGKHGKVQLLLHAECWLGDHGLTNLTDLFADILRSILADADLDLKEKSVYTDLLPSGMPARMLDQVAALFVDAVRDARSGDTPRQSEEVENVCTNPR
jgi:hypothetical protein